MARLPVVLAVAVALAGCAPNDRPAREGSPGATTRRAAPLPEPRTEVTGTAIGNSILAVGGLLADGTATARVDRYDAASDTWGDGPALPVALHHAAAVAARGRAWVVGGYTNDAEGRWQESARVWSLGPGERAWRDESPLPAPRGAAAAAAADDGTIVVMGGTSGGEVVATTVLLRPGAQRWESGPDMREPREHLAATAIGARVYAIAGRVGSLESNRRTVESLDPSNPEGAWRREPPLHRPRGGASAAGRCVAGGEEPSATIGTVECLDEDGDGWAVTAEMASPRHGLAAAAIAGRLHLVGGGERPGLFVSAVHEVLEVER